MKKKENYAPPPTPKKPKLSKVTSKNEKAMEKMNKYIARQVAKQGLYPAHLFLRSTKNAQTKTLNQHFLYPLFTNCPFLFRLAPEICRCGY